MFRKDLKNLYNQDRKGIVLLVTLVLLVVLSTLGYTMTGRLAAQRHRDQYTIDYCNARYGCDSGVKYAMATLEELDPQLVSRPNEPDFSDLFNMSDAEYEELLAKLARKAAESAGGFGTAAEDVDVNVFKGILDVNDLNGIGDSRDYNDVNGLADSEQEIPQIPGPYGPPWPLVAEPVEFEIGSAKVKIEIEDENAKYPLGWALIDNKEQQNEAEAGLETFCEWARMEPNEIDLLKKQLKQISDIKPFKVDFNPIAKVERTPAPTTAPGSNDPSLRRTPRTRITRKTITADEQIAEQTVHFSRLLHSSLIDSEALARPKIVSRNRQESPLRYMGTWGSTKVNINTAPRHVLEATFTFGGDADKIAHEIIRFRQTKPFENLDELKKSLVGYSDSIRKCENYITTVSNFFTVKVTAVSGVAKASSIIAITKNGKKVQRVAVING